jgi:uncharacterized membrane protein YfcA
MLDLSLSGTDLLLVGVWFGVSLWNTSIGPTGGITFASMASVLPPTAVIPIQAVVESASSIFRVFLLRDLVDLRFLVLFMIGGTVGFGIGLAARVLMPPSDALLQIIMGTFILVTTWVPLSKLRFKSEGIPWMVGLGTSFASLFIGGVAALIAVAIDQKDADHGKVIATMTASLIYQHSVKVVIFGLLGFSFAAYADLMIAMFLAAIAGTWVGKKILVSVRQDIIKLIFKILVTALGLKVLADGLHGI